MTDTHKVAQEGLTRTTVWFPASVARKLERLKKQMGTSRNQVIVNACSAYAAEQEKVKQ